MGEFVPPAINRSSSVDDGRLDVGAIDAPDATSMMGHGSRWIRPPRVCGMGGVAGGTTVLHG